METAPRSAHNHGEVMALGFTAPWLLGGLSLAAIPLVLHLLYRRRYRESPWAAMQFLIAAAKKQRRWLQFDQWLLLALRMLIPITTAIALAGPTFRSPGQPTTVVPVQRIVVVDTSLSLQAREGTVGRFERIRQRVRELTSQARTGDMWQLVRIGPSGSAGVIAQPVYEPSPLLEELAALNPDESRGDVVAALQTVSSLLTGQAHVGPRHVYLISDNQRTAFRPPADAVRAAIHTELERIAGAATLHWLDVAEEPVENLAVTGLTSSTPLVLSGEPLRLTATIENHGLQDRDDVVGEWRIDGRLIGVDRGPVPRGQPIERTLQFTPTTTGDVRIEFRLPADGLPVDDRRGLVSHVRAEIPVLLVDGRPSGTLLEGAADLLRLALSPDSESGGRGGIRATVISDGQLLGTELAAYAAVFLCDVSLLAERDAEHLRSYVAAGGSLVIGLGPHVRAESYNRLFDRDPEGLLPARLDTVRGDARQREQSFAFDPLDYQHPIVQPFRGNPNTGLELTQTFAYYRLRPRDKGVATILAFDTQDPALIEGPFGAGRVLLCATSFDRSWSTWAVWGHSFVPMMQELVRDLAGSQRAGRTLLVGESLVIPAELRRQRGGTTIRLPNDETRGASCSDDLSERCRWTETSRSGFYAVETSGAATEAAWFAVNVDPAESDLTPLTSGQLRDELLAGIDATYELSSDEAPLMSTGTMDGTNPSPWPRVLLAVVFWLLIVEPFLTWNRPLAGMVLAAGALLAALSTLGPWGVVGGILATAMIAAYGWRECRSPSAG